MKIILLSILLATLNNDLPKSLDDLLDIWELDDLLNLDLYSNDKKKTARFSNLVPVDSQGEAYGTELKTRLDTCDGAAILEPMLDQVYDSMVYKWYFEGNIINEATPSIQVQKPGEYTVEILGILNGDVLLTQQTFVVPEVLTLQEVNITHTSCNEKNGSLRIKANYEIGMQYSIDGENFQSENFFDNLAAGSYTVTIKDNFNCMDSQQIAIESSSPPVIEKIEAIPAICGENNGGIVYEVSGGTGQISASLNSGNALPINNSFQKLAQGEYTLTFIDEAECTLTSTISVPGAKCPIYVPNAFSPNGDGINDLFKIEAKTGSNSKINTCLIFDRWGKQLYKAHNFFINSSDQWWDGTIKNKKVGAGTYIYLIEVEFDNNEIEILQGEINIIR